MLAMENEITTAAYTYVDGVEQLEAPLSPRPKKVNLRSSSGTTPKAKTPTKGDRFIPSRSAMDMDISHFNLMKENANPNEVYTPSKAEYKERLAETLFDGKLHKEAKILAFKNKAPAPKEHLNPQRVLYSANSSSAQPPKKGFRAIPSQPERILDAPNFVDDYYLNLLDWSSTDHLAIALGNSVFLWNAATGSASELMKTADESNIVTSVSWVPAGNYLAIGMNDGKVELWDVPKAKPVRRFEGHERRVGALCWRQHILSTGSRDTTIRNYDVRQRDPLTSILSGHSQEVCGLKWSDDGNFLASGGNDNVVNVWDINNQNTPKWQFTEHQAAVKALAWCPWQKDLLATGGGTADRTIKFWNVTTGTLLNSIDTQSQVSQLMWSKNPNCKEIISAHGYAQNQLTVWKYPSLLRVAELKAHDQRIISLAMSPDGTTVVSGAADETLCFWKVFDVQESKKVKVKSAVSSSSVMTKTIR